MKFGKEMYIKKEVEYRELNPTLEKKMGTARKRVLRRVADKYPLFAEKFKQEKEKTMLPISDYVRMQDEKKACIGRGLRKMHADRWRAVRRELRSLSNEGKAEVIKLYNEEGIYTSNRLQDLVWKWEQRYELYEIARKSHGDFSLVPFLSFIQ